MAEVIAIAIVAGIALAYGIATWHARRTDRREREALQQSEESDRVRPLGGGGPRPKK